MSICGACATLWRLEVDIVSFYIVFPSYFLLHFCLIILYWEVVHATSTLEWRSGQLLEMTSLFSLCESWQLNSACQTEWQTPLPIEPSHWSSHMFLFLFCCCSLFLHQGASLNLELTMIISPAGQQAEFTMSQSPQHWGYGHVPACLAFFMWVLRIRSSWLSSKHFFH